MAPVALSSATARSNVFGTWRVIALRSARRRLAAFLVAALALIAPGPARAGDEARPADRYLVRFEFDNDVFLGSDDAFSAGWSLQLHSPLLVPGDARIPRLLRGLPGIGHGDPGRTVRWSVGLSQIIVTPHDVENPAPQPRDAPWAGILGVYGSLASYDNRDLSAVQLYLGCMGPCSGAEQVQTVVHRDLLGGSAPAGWGNQLATRILANLNVERRYKVVAPPDSAYSGRRWASDLSVGGQLGVGNLATFAQAEVEWRFGWGLPMGFTHVPDPTGLGIALDPLHVDHEAPSDERPRWRGYGSLVVRATALDYFAPAEGGRTVNGGWHPRVDGQSDTPQLLLGLHVGRYPVAFHVTYYRYITGRQPAGLKSSLDWVNLSFEYRL